MTALLDESQDSQVIIRRPRGDRSTIVRRQRLVRFAQVATAVAIPAALLALWQVASTSEWIDPRVYPAPQDIVRAGADVWSAGRLQDAIWDSLRVILIGFALGALLGIAVGFVTGVSAFLRAALEPLLMGLYVVPKLALLPVFLTIFGFDMAPKVALVVVTVFFFVWIDVMESLWRIPAGYLDAARSLDMNRRQLFRHVRLPAIVPTLFVSLRISMGVAVLVTIAGEFIIGGKGLGYFIFSSNQYYQLDRVYAGIVTVALLGVALSWLISLAGRLAAPWTRGARS